jgi:hypothetical protein
MTAIIRVLLYIVAGWLGSSGWISPDVERILTSDPEIVAAVQILVNALVSAFLASPVVAWWRWAKRQGWPT